MWRSRRTERRRPTRARPPGSGFQDQVRPEAAALGWRFGALNSSDPERGLAAVGAFLAAPIRLVPFEGDAASHHADVRLALRHTPIGEGDLVIAWTARAWGLTLITRNQRHFERVPDLSVEDWTAEPTEASDG